mmetsp:Transcript_144356/g.254489  ORF Transcript_144356/g.254489 Transcript_144356/m.254489 type:complete len:522 (-) Transcript_144356:41-1606(-)
MLSPNCALVQGNMIKERHAQVKTTKAPKKAASCTRHNRGPREISLGLFSEFGQDQVVDDKKRLQLCQSAVPGWSNLPQSVVVKSERAFGGTHSPVYKFRLEGVGKDKIKPAECVHGFYDSAGKGGDSYAVRNQLTIAAGEVAVGPRIYAAVGKHMVMEACPGTHLFGGAQASHFLATMYWGSSLSSGAENVEVMEALGEALGTLHAIRLDELANTLSQTEAAKLEEQIASPVFFPMKGQACTCLREQILSSSALPRHGLFARPVCCHGDLHGGNILHDARSGQVRFVDWEFACIGHRGIDLSYFFLCAPGATMASRRAFARAYLSKQTESGVKCSSHELKFDVGSAAQAHDAVPIKAVDKFLWEIECCMPLGLAHMAQLSCNIIPWVTGDIVDLAETVLTTLEATINSKDGKGDFRVGMVHAALHGNDDDNLLFKWGEITSRWRCVAKRMAVRKERSVKSKIVHCLMMGDEIMVQGEPVDGWVRLLNDHWALIKHESVGQLLERVDSRPRRTGPRCPRGGG